MKTRFLLFWLAWGAGYCSLRGQTGLWVGYDVPYPTRYQVRYTGDGRSYVVVQEFTRRQTGDFIAPQTVGVVQQIRQSHGGGVHVTLRAGNGLVFGVHQGQVVTVGGRAFRADGFHNGVFVMTCPQSGQQFYFTPQR